MVKSKYGCPATMIQPTRYAVAWMIIACPMVYALTRIIRIGLHNKDVLIHNGVTWAALIIAERKVRNMSAKSTRKDHHGGLLIRFSHVGYYAYALGGPKVD